MQRIDIHVSHYFFVTICIFLMILTALILCLPSHFFIQAISLLLLGFIGFQLLRSVFLKENHSIVSLTLKPNNQWLIETRWGIFLAELCDDSVITHLVSVLCFKIINQKRVITNVIFKDASSSYQLLLMYLLLFSDQQRAVSFDRQLPQK